MNVAGLLLVGTRRMVETERWVVYGGYSHLVGSVSPGPQRKREEWEKRNQQPLRWVTGMGAYESITVWPYFNACWRLHAL